MDEGNDAGPVLIFQPLVFLNSATCLSKAKPVITFIDYVHVATAALSPFGYCGKASKISDAELAIS